MHNMTLPGWKNKLYFGDNLDILREHVASESVDLIYLDPPFKVGADFSMDIAVALAGCQVGRYIENDTVRVLEITV